MKTISQHTLPARKAAAIQLTKGQSIKIINTFGKQVVDFFAFGIDHPTEYLSMPHTRAMLQTIFPKQGNNLYSSRRRAMLTFVSDTSPGVHDTVWPACDAERYRMMGCSEYHDNCSDNLHGVLRERFPAQAIRDEWTPDPLNLFMNVEVGEGGELALVSPVSEEGQYVVLRAEMDLVVAMSACPQDLNAVNGAGPASCEFEVLV